MPACGRHRPDP